MANLFEKTIIGVIDVIGCVYELIVFVPYYFLCKPYKKMERSQRIKVCLSFIPLGIFVVTEIQVLLFSDIFLNEILSWNVLHFLLDWTK